MLPRLALLSLLDVDVFVAEKWHLLLSVQFVLNISTDIDGDKEYQMELIKEHLPFGIDIRFCGIAEDWKLEIEEDSFEIKELS